MRQGMKFISGSLGTLALLLPLFLISSCTHRGGGSSLPPAAKSHPVAQERTEESPAIFEQERLPATFKGTIPCDGCNGIEVHLNLRSDSTFQIRRTYLFPDKKSNPILDRGTWSLSPDQREIILHLKNSMPQHFRMADANCIKSADPSLQNTVPTEPSVMKLCRTAAFEPIQSEEEMRGLYSYMADLGMFKDCRTSQRYPVATERDNAALERAYLNTDHGIAEPILVRFIGHVTTRPAMEGSKMDKVVVVDRFIEITGKHSCKEGAAPAMHTSGSGEVPEKSQRLENIKWELTEIAGSPVVMPQGMPAPGFKLNPNGHNLRGFGGCNRMMGSYMLDGHRLMFSGIATTRKFCEETQGLEDRFLQALGQVRKFSIDGDILSLYGDYGELAKLKSSQIP